jgi:hypothetical protein
MARTRFSRWRERRQREAGNREAVRSGHGLVSLGVPPPVPARDPVEVTLGCRGTHVMDEVGVPEGFVPPSAALAPPPPDYAD